MHGACVISHLECLNRIFGYDCFDGVVEKVGMPANSVIEGERSLTPRDSDSLQGWRQCGEEFATHHVEIEIDIFGDVWLDSGNAVENVVFKSSF